MFKHFFLYVLDRRATLVYVFQTMRTIIKGYVCCISTRNTSWKPSFAEVTNMGFCIFHRHWSHNMFVIESSASVLDEFMEELLNRLCIYCRCFFNIIKGSTSSQLPKYLNAPSKRREREEDSTPYLSLLPPLHRSNLPDSSRLLSSSKKFL